MKKGWNTHVIEILKLERVQSEQLHTNKIENSENIDNFHRKKCNLPKLTQEEIENQRDL